MNKGQLSCLTRIETNITENDCSIIQIIDPIENSINETKIDCSTSLEDIFNIIKNIGRNVQLGDNVRDGYKHWIKNGWGFSLDYYIASRQRHKERRLNCNTQGSISSDNFDPEHVNNDINNTLQAIYSRRTKRQFSDMPVPIGILLSGVKCLKSLFNGEIFPFEFFFVVYNVDGLPQSIQSYEIKTCNLNIIRKGDFSIDISNYTQGMRTPKSAAFSIILTGNLEQISDNFPYEKGLRDAYIELGRIAQHIIIEYMKSDIYCLVTPALSDSSISDLLMLTGDNKTPMYSLTFGYSEQTPST